MLLPLSALVPGFLLLAFSADMFVNNAIALAHRLKVSPRLIGLLLMSLGTSAPEILVSVSAALTDRENLAIGNALGSNIANIGLVMGITLLLSPLLPGFVKAGKELGLMALVTVAAGVVLYDRSIGQLDALLMLTASLVCTGLLYRWQQTSPEPATEPPPAPTSQPTEADSPSGSMTTTVLALLTGLVLLLASSRLLVWAAAAIARDMHISELAIGLTVIALGTSLPELAACLASALTGRQDMAVATITGSNIFNLLVVMAIPGVAAPVPVAEAALVRDYAVMLALTGVLLVVLRPVSKDGQLWKRGPGLLLILGYLAYSLCLATL